MKIQIKGVGKFPKKYRIALIIALDLLILAGSYFLIFASQFEQKNRLAAEISTAQQELNKLIAVKNNIEKTRREYAELKANLQDVLRQMPEEKEVPNLLRQVSFTAQETKTRIKYFAPKDVQVREFYAELPFEIKYNGPYHNIGYFFDGVRKMERIIHIASFSLESKGAREKVVLEGSCVAKTYIYVKEAPKDKTKDKKKEEKNEAKK